MFNSREYRTLRKELRNRATPAERLLWQYLRRQFLGYKFRRQQGIGRYVVDFYCPKLRLVIEIDGDTHSGNDAEQYNEERTAFLESCWIHVVRFTNNDVLKNIEGVIEVLRWEMFILEWKKDHPDSRCSSPLLN